MYYKEIKIQKHFKSESINFRPDLSEVNYKDDFKLPLYGNEQFMFYKRNTKDKKVWTCPLVTKITKTVFDNCIKIFITETNFCYAAKKGNKWVGDSKTYCIRLGFDGIPYFTLDKKFSSRAFSDFINCFRKCKIYLSNLNIDLLNDVEIPQSLKNYFYQRNPKLRELPASQRVLEEIYYCDYYTDKNLKARIRYHLKKGNTKKATEHFLRGTYPKSIRKYFLNNIDNWDILKKKDLIEFYLKNISIDDLVFVLNKTHDAAEVFKIYLKFNKRYSLKHILKDFVNTRFDSLYIDAYRCFSTLKFEYNLEYFPGNKESIKEYHDRVSDMLSTLRATRRSNLEERYKEDVTSQLLTQEYEGYTIRPLKNIFEMKDIGNHMHICVGGYMRYQYEKRLEIAVVIDPEGKYTACLEIVKESIIQAKLSRNYLVSSDEFICGIVTQWAEYNKLKITTPDMQQNSDNVCDVAFF